MSINPQEVCPDDSQCVFCDELLPDDCGEDTWAFEGFCSAQCATSYHAQQLEKRAWGLWTHDTPLRQYRAAAVGIGVPIKEWSIPADAIRQAMEPGPRGPGFEKYLLIECLRDSSGCTLTQTIATVDANWLGWLYPEMHEHSWCWRIWDDKHNCIAQRLTKIYPEQGQRT